jgi:hypothetical protein
MEKDIRKACVFLRDNNNTIPSEIIEFMLQASLKQLKEIEKPKTNSPQKIRAILMETLKPGTDKGSTQAIVDTKDFAVAAKKITDEFNL